VGVIKFKKKKTLKKEEENLKTQFRKTNHFLLYSSDVCAQLRDFSFVRDTLHESLNDDIEAAIDGQ